MSTLPGSTNRGEKLQSSGGKTPKCNKGFDYPQKSQLREFRSGKKEPKRKNHLKYDSMGRKNFQRFLKVRKKSENNKKCPKDKIFRKNCRKTQFEMSEMFTRSRFSTQSLRTLIISARKGRARERRRRFAVEKSKLWLDERNREIHEIALKAKRVEGEKQSRQRKKRGKFLSSPAHERANANTLLTPFLPLVSAHSLLFLSLSCFLSPSFPQSITR